MNASAGRPARVVLVAWTLLLSLSLVLVVVTTTAHAQPAAPGSAPAGAPQDPAAAELQQKMIQAYQNTQQYASKVDFSIQQTQGRWTNIRSGYYTVAFDRAGNKLSLDQPEILVVSDGQKLRFKVEQATGHHVETAAPQPLDFAALTTAVPFLSQIPLPDVVALTSADPVAQISGGTGKAVRVEPDPADALKRPGLRFDTEAGKMTLRLDPQSHLITAAVLEVDTSQFGGGAGASMSINYDIKIQSHNQPLAADKFAFDTTNSKAVDSVQALIAAAQGGAGAGPGGGGHPLEGKAMPEVTLNSVEGKEVKLADDASSVIVLDFWATWCGPCREGLPKLQEVHDWAKQNNKSVSIYAVNIAETPEQVKKFWEQAKLSMPVLMDTQSKVADAYGVQGIPQTVIIAGGKVQHVHVGYDPGMTQMLKGEIEELLATPATPEAAPQAPAPPPAAAPEAAPAMP